MRHPGSKKDCPHSAGSLASDNFLINIGSYTDSWILAIVFALNDDNLNRRNFARGYWCGVLVAVIVVVILSIVGMVMGVSIMDGFSSYQYNYRY